MERRQDDSFQRQVLNTLGDIKALCATAEAHHEAVVERVNKLEGAANRQWWVSYVVTPGLFVLHTIARQLGARI